MEIKRSLFFFLLLLALVATTIEAAKKRSSSPKSKAVKSRAGKAKAPKAKGSPSKSKGSSSKSKGSPSKSKRASTSRAKPQKNLEFTVPLFLAARGPHDSAADYLDRVYPGIRYAEKSKNEYLNTFYATNISLGTKFQEVSVRVKTSGSGLWTYEKGCYTRFVGVYMPKKYYMKRSKSKKLDERQELHDRITDVFKIDEYVNPKQPFVAATSQLPSKPKGFVDPIEPARLLNVHGVLSLGPSEKKDGITPVWAGMMETLKKPVYTVFLKRNSQQCNNNLVGHVTFGGWNKALCNETNPGWKFTTNMKAKGTKWTIQLEKFYFSEQKENSKNLVEPSKTTASLELGASHIYAPKEVVEAVAKEARARREAGTWVVKCADFDWLYDFIFYIDGKKILIPARHFVVDIGLGNDECALTIDESTRLNVDWVLGDPFLHMFCTTFDQKAKKVSFMKSIETVCEV
ncbi:Peptidase A1 domain-containing protein [Aphelenchoides fujianensis]|nr:Peptidase A1 domain-containing protein [Aphelenchoides fujianensis]